MPSDPKSRTSAQETSCRRSVRESRPSDAGAITRILGDANLSALPSSAPQGVASNQSGVNHVHVCENGSEVVAVLQWRQLGREAEIFDIAVEPAHRRQGLATLLLKRVLSLAKERGAQEIFLEVRESNAAALALYRKFGFIVAGRRLNYYRHPDETALLLRLRFTA